jgi:hypothetical protein
MKTELSSWVNKKPARRTPQPKTPWLKEPSPELKAALVSARPE